MLKYHWRGNEEEEGGGFCYLPSLETERWFPLPFLSASSHRVTASSRIPAWVRRSPFRRCQGGLPLLPQVWGCLLCLIPAVISAPRELWCLMQLISVCSCCCLMLGDGPSPGKRKRKMMGEWGQESAQYWGFLSHLRPEESWVSLAPRQKSHKWDLQIWKLGYSN